jgi:hypothetical protein
MNSFMQYQWSWIEGSHGMRTELLDALTDSDLAFSPGGSNMTLGALCVEMGDIEHAYIQSLKTFSQHWNDRNTQPGLAGSVAQIKAWYDAMDADMKATVEAFSDADLDKMVTRDSGYQVPAKTQLEIYLQALLIFFGKAVVYLRAMNKPVPKNIVEWIG